MIQNGFDWSRQYLRKMRGENSANKCQAGTGEKCEMLVYSVGFSIGCYDLDIVVSYLETLEDNIWLYMKMEEENIFYLEYNKQAAYLSTKGSNRKN